MSAPTTRRPHQRELRRVTIGKGPGFAVSPPSAGNLVTTADTLIEGVHFDLSYTNPRELGHKALAVGLSDVAAMGAKPLHAHVTIGVRQETSEPFLMELAAGLEGLARRQKMGIAVTSSLPSPTALLVQTTILASITRAPVRYTGARSGDLIAVTGSVGTSAAGLACLRALGRHALASTHEDLLRAHLMPVPRIAEAQALVKQKAVTAMIELSDGFAADLHALVAASGVGAYVEENLLPVSRATLRAGELMNTPHRAWTLYGGEDFELIATVPKSLAEKAQRAVKKAGGTLTFVGEIRARKDGVVMKDHTGELVPLQPRLWHHFVRRRRRVAG